MHSREHLRRRACCPEKADAPQRLPEEDCGMKKKAFRKLKRTELVDLIYELRKDNLALEEQNASLRRRLKEVERLQEAYEAAPNEAVLEKISGLLLALCDACNVPESRLRECGAGPEDRT